MKISESKLRDIVREEIKRITEQDVSAEEIVQVIWGDYKRPRGGNPLKILTKKAFEKTFGGRSGIDRYRIIFNADEVKDGLKNLGFSDNEIQEIRSIVTDSLKKVRDYIVRKHDVPEKYVDEIEDNFGVYTFHLAVDEDITDEFWQMGRQLVLNRLIDAGY